MTTNTPEAWEETQKKAIYAILDKMYANKNYIDCAYEDIRSLLHTTKVELLREVSQMFNDLADVGLEPALEKSAIHSLASRHGITEEELNQKEV